MSEDRLVNARDTTRPIPT